MIIFFYLEFNRVNEFQTRFRTSHPMTGMSYQNFDKLLDKKW